MVWGHTAGLGTQVLSQLRVRAIAWGHKACLGTWGQFRDTGADLGPPSLSWLGVWDLFWGREAGLGTQDWFQLRVWGWTWGHRVVLGTQCWFEDIGSVLVWGLGAGLETEGRSQFQDTGLVLGTIWEHEIFALGVGLGTQSRSQSGGHSIDWGTPACSQTGDTGQLPLWGYGDDLGTWNPSAGGRSPDRCCRTRIGDTGTGGPWDRWAPGQEDPGTAGPGNRATVGPRDTRTA